MTEYFSPEGVVVPVTIVSAGPTIVTQVKTKASDGYEAVQVGFGSKSAKRINKAEKGHMKDLGNFLLLKEIENATAGATGEKLESTLEAGDTEPENKR